MIVPGSYSSGSCLCSETNQLILDKHILAGILISSLLITLEQNQVKVAPAFADRAWKHLQLPWHWGLTVESELHAGPIRRIFESGRGVFSSASSWIVSTTPLSPANWNFPSFLIHRDHFNDLLVHQREAVGLLAQLSATRTLVHVPESRLSNLRVDLRLETPSDHQSIVVANACAARLFDFSISFVVNDMAELEVDPAPAPSLCLRKQCGCGWAVHRLAWQQRAQRAHEEHVVLSMNDFDELPLSQTRKSKILSLDFLKRHPGSDSVAARLRPETMPGAKHFKQTHCFRFPPLMCLKL